MTFRKFLRIATLGISFAALAVAIATQDKEDEDALDD
jgi:hypothetical protein